MPFSYGIQPLTLSIAWNLPPLLTALSTPYALMILHHCQHTADFTLRATDTGDDMLSGEDKPSHIVRKDLQTAIVKNRNLRILSTQVAKKRLPHPRLNTYFDAFTTTWHGLQLVVDETKKIEGPLIHYRAAECVVSLLPGKTSTVQGGLLIQGMYCIDLVYVNHACVLSHVSSDVFSLPRSPWVSSNIQRWNYFSMMVDRFSICQLQR